MKSLRALSLPLLFGCLGILSGCQSGTTTSPTYSSTPEIAGNAVLKIGVTADAAPMVFKQAGQLTGFEIEMGGNLGEFLKRPVQFVEVAWEDQIKSLQSGKTDIIMSSMSITPERRMLTAFSTPYMHVGQMMLVQRTDLYRYALGIPSMLPGTVGVQSGTVGEFLVESRYARSKKKSYRTMDAAVEDLVNKRIGLVISDAQIVWYQAALNESKGLAVVPNMLSQEYLGWPVRTQDGELLKKVNEFISQKQNDGSMNEAIRRWMPLAK